MATTFRTMCPMNCHPTLCGMLVDVEHGKVVGVRGDPENPDSHGFLCVRGQASREILDNDQRLLHPMMRATRSDEWRRVAWDEALDTIAARMRAVGRESVAVWTGHGLAANNYGTRLHGYLMRRFSNLYGSQSWNAAMICWGLGGFGFGVTGLSETNTKEDLGAHANLVLLWGANLASQPNTARHVAAARRRGAYVVTIDVRETEAARQSDEVIVVKPGTDAALALAMMHVIVAQQRHDRAFVERHTVGFDRLADHVRTFTPAWAAPITGVPAETIVALARRYATTKPAMIVAGGSSMYKGTAGWQASRAISCLPPLTGNLGIPGGGLGPRHGTGTHFTSITADSRRPPGRYVPNQMSRIADALVDGSVKVLMLAGTDMMSSFADSGRVAEGLERADLVVSFDLFMNDTARRFAHIVLPGTAWVEELGAKATNTHVYLMPRIVDAPGQCRTPTWMMRELARRLDVKDFFPWDDDAGPLDAILDHPRTRQATVAALTAEGGMRALDISHVAHPDLKFPTPSGKIEFYSERAAGLGLPALPTYEPLPESPSFPLRFRQGRTLTHFHGFYDHGRALPSLAAADPEPELWIAPDDATPRNITDKARIRIWNERGEMLARAHVTARIPAGTVWMRDGWTGLNTLTDGAAVLPDAATDIFGFSAGQATFDAAVDVALPGDDDCCE